MDLIPYSDSDEESNQSSSDNDEIIEISQNPVITQQLNFKAKPMNTNTKNKIISLDFGTDTTHKSLFDSLPFPSKASLHQNIPTKKKKKKSKKHKNKKKHNKKRKLQQISLIDILPQPKHKKPKISPPPTKTIKISENTSNKIETEPEPKTIKSNNNNEIQTNDIRKKQAEVHRKYTNPLATFSISNENNNTIEQPIQSETINKNVSIQFETNDNITGVQFETASSMYRVDNNNNMNYEYNNYDLEYEKDNYEIERDNEKDKNDRIKYLREQFKESKNVKKRDNDDNDEIIDISHNELIGNKKPWMRSFEIDDITKQDITHVSTNTYNPKTGMVEAVKKYTKTQKRKHQINTLAYEAQEKALQLAMQKSASYKTKAETQAKYGW
eukprot:365871_1